MNEIQDTRPFAVVTGGSSGIGFELARQFVQHGYDVLIAAEGNGLVEAATVLSQNGGTVQSIAVDLTKSDGVDQLYGRIQEAGRPVDAICINAGVGVSGHFTETNLQKEIDLINLNVISSVHLAKHVVRDMVARNGGRVLFTSSVAAVMPSPFEAVYGASKAFLLIFSESLASELKDSDVTITAVLPGPTETNFFHRAGMDDTKVGQDQKDNVAEVAQRAFDAMMAGKEKVYVGSFKNRVMGMLGDLLPDDVGADAHRKMSQPLSEQTSVG